VKWNLFTHFKLYFFKIPFSIFLLSTPRSSSFSFNYRGFNQNVDANYRSKYLTNLCVPNWLTCHCAPEACYLLWQVTKSASSLAELNGGSSRCDLEEVRWDPDNAYMCRGKCGWCFSGEMSPSLPWVTFGLEGNPSLPATYTIQLDLCYSILTHRFLGLYTFHQFYDKVGPGPSTYVS